MDSPRIEIRELVYPFGAPAYRWELIEQTPAGDVTVAESTRTFTTEPLARLAFERARVMMAGMPALTEVA